MLRKLLVSIGAASFFTTGLLSAAVAATAWMPVGSWAFDTQGERCAAAQTYAAAGRQLTVGFKLQPMSDRVTILLQLPGQPTRIDQRKVRVNFGAGYEQKDAMLRRSSKAGFGLYEIGADRADLALLARTGRLAARGTDLNLDVTVAGLNSVLASLDACMSDLLSRWGLSKEDQARLERFPEPVSDAYFGPEDYPGTALGRSAIGSVEVVVTVSADGRASSCRIVRSSGHQDIDKATCENARNMRFKPAVSRDGKPMKSPYYIRVSWLTYNP